MNTFSPDVLFWLRPAEPASFQSLVTRVGLGWLRGEREEGTLRERDVSHISWVS